MLCSMMSRVGIGDRHPSHTWKLGNIVGGHWMTAEGSRECSGRCVRVSPLPFASPRWSGCYPRETSESLVSKASLGMGSETGRSPGKNCIQKWVDLFWYILMQLLKNSNSFLPRGDQLAIFYGAHTSVAPKFTPGLSVQISDLSKWLLFLCSVCDVGSCIDVMLC